MTFTGIDISEYQRGLNVGALKDQGVSFSILKCGEGRKLADPCFDQFYNAATAAGIAVGAYFFSYATTVETAVKDARRALELVKGRKLPLGIYIDVEDAGQLALRDSELTAVVKAFCDTIRAAGYRPGAYGSAGQLWAKVGAKYLGDDVLVWAASWGGKPKIGCDVWQYTDKRTFSGYNGPVDGDNAMSDRFADLITGSTPATEPDEPSPEPVTPDPAPAPEQPAEDEKETFTLLGVPVLRKGDTGDDVKAMQGELLALGYSCGGKRFLCGHENADGIFGNVTEESVRSFQRSRNLPDNGIVGPKTRAALLGI